MYQYHQQLKKWDFNLIVVLILSILSVISCEKIIDSKKSKNLTPSALKISGSFFDFSKENSDLVKIDIPHQCVSSEIESEINQLIQTTRSQKISGNIKNLNGFSTKDYLKLEKINHDTDLFVFGQSLFTKNGDSWDKYSADSYWKLIHKCMSQKKIIFHSTVIHQENVLPGIPNYDPNAF
jgi:hypothetical protein